MLVGVKNMKKDIYMGLDKELVLNIIFNTSCKKTL